MCGSRAGPVELLPVCVPVWRRAPRQLFVLALSKLLAAGSALQDVCRALLSVASTDNSLLRNEVHHMEVQLQAILAEDEPL